MSQRKYKYFGQNDDVTLKSTQCLVDLIVIMLLSYNVKIPERWLLGFVIRQTNSHYNKIISSTFHHFISHITIHHRAFPNMPC